jgi:hypothetical protein
MAASRYVLARIPKPVLTSAWKGRPGCVRDRYSSRGWVWLYRADAYVAAPRTASVVASPASAATLAHVLSSQLLTDAHVEVVVAHAPCVSGQEDMDVDGLEEVAQGLARGLDKRVEDEQLSRQGAGPLLWLCTVSFLPSLALRMLPQRA